jgi:hypothetical protein
VLGPELVKLNLTTADPLQEWNGRREITEKTFKYDSFTTPRIFFMAVIFPATMYFIMRDELVSGTCRRGQLHMMGSLFSGSDALGASRAPTQSSLCRLLAC